MTRARLLGKDPNSQAEQLADAVCDRPPDRATCIAQGWKVTDAQALADIGPVPDHEALIEIPEDVLKFYARRYAEEDR